MELNQQNLTALAHYLTETVNPDPTKRKAAENFLQDLGKQRGFTLLLLKLIEMHDVDLQVRQAGSVFFKNYIKQHWAQKDEGPISAEDREQIKGNIINLMLNVPPQVQKQLAAVVQLIGDIDFPNNWKELLPELVKRLETQDFRVINGILHTAFSIFKRYRQLMKSPTVLTELQYVLSLFQAPLLQLFQATSTLIDSKSSNPKELVPLFTAIKQMVRIFYTLNCIDLPEFFEDHMEEWMNLFRKFLLSEINYVELVGDEDDEKPGLLHKVQAGICQNLNLYIGKYEEEFQPYYHTFVKDVWTLLLKLGQQPKFDIVTAP